MPPERGRASRACTSCRKIKTRCYESDIAGKPCLRCDRLGQACSLDTRPVKHDDSRSRVNLNHNNSSPSNDDRYGSCSQYYEGHQLIHSGRLSRLEETVNSLVKRLDEAGTHQPVQVTPSTASPKPPVSDPLQTAHSTAPILLLRDVASEVRMPQQHSTEVLQRTSRESLDIIDKGLISIQEAYAMIELSVSLPLWVTRLMELRFQEHYGRWVAFSAISSHPSLLDEVRRSPLLLCSCCLIAIRHNTQDLDPTLAPKLFQEAKSLLSSNMLEVPQSIEFFQSTLILSMWSTTIGQTPLSIDSWLISGIALQHGLASDVFAHITNAADSSSLGKDGLDRWCIWNHICLVHLQ